MSAVISIAQYQGMMYPLNGIATLDFAKESFPDEKVREKNLFGVLGRRTAVYLASQATHDAETHKAKERFYKVGMIIEANVMREFDKVYSFSCSRGFCESVGSLMWTDWVCPEEVSPRQVSLGNGRNIRNLLPKLNQLFRLEVSRPNGLKASIDMQLASETLIEMVKSIDDHRILSKHAELRWISDAEVELLTEKEVVEWLKTLVKVDCKFADVSGRISPLVNSVATIFSNEMTFEFHQGITSRILTVNAVPCSKAVQEVRNKICPGIVPREIKPVPILEVQCQPLNPMDQSTDMKTYFKILKQRFDSFQLNAAISMAKPHFDPSPSTPNPKSYSDQKPPTRPVN